MSKGNAVANTSGRWLVKSEESVYSIADLEREVVTPWDGVRNYQARNMMRDEMKPGDLVLFYHSNADVVGVAGVGRVAGDAYADASQFDEASPYFDPKSDPDDPTWVHVDVEFVERFASVVPLATLKKDARLAEMPLLQRGQRLSIQPVARPHFARVVSLGRNP